MTERHSAGGTTLGPPAARAGTHGSARGRGRSSGRRARAAARPDRAQPGPHRGPLGRCDPAPAADGQHRRSVDPPGLRRPAGRPGPQAAVRRGGGPGPGQGLDHRHQRAHAAGPLAAAGRPGQRRAQPPRGVRGRDPHRAHRLDGLGDPAADDGPAAGGACSTSTSATAPSPGSPSLGPDAPSWKKGRPRSGTVVVPATRTADGRAPRRSEPPTRSRLGCARVSDRPPDPGDRHRAGVVASAAVGPLRSTCSAGWAPS